MRPFLENDRDKALLVKPSSIKVGDPVLAEVNPLHFVLHRIDSIEGDNVTLRGDGNLGVEHCKKRKYRRCRHRFLSQRKKRNGRYRRMEMENI